MVSSIEYKVNNVDNYEVVLTIEELPLDATEIRVKCDNVLLHKFIRFQNLEYLVLEKGNLIFNEYEIVYGFSKLKACIIKDNNKVIYVNKSTEDYEFIYQKDEFCQYLNRLKGNSEKTELMICAGYYNPEMREVIHTEFTDIDKDEYNLSDLTFGGYFSLIRD